MNNKTTCIPVVMNYGAMNFTKFEVFLVGSYEYGPLDMTDEEIAYNVRAHKELCVGSAKVLIRSCLYGESVKECQRVMLEMFDERLNLPDQEYNELIYAENFYETWASWIGSVRELVNQYRDTAILHQIQVYTSIGMSWQEGDCVVQAELDDPYFF